VETAYVIARGAQFRDLVWGLVLGASLALAEEAPVEEGWSQDVAASLQKAAAESKDLLMCFIGSDWDDRSAKLKREIVDHKGFFEAASKIFVPVELDFPRQRQVVPEVGQQNREWCTKLGVQIYPTVVLTDSTGKPYARVSYQSQRRDEYLKHLTALRSIRIERDEALTKAASLSGVERAKQLDAALARLGPALVALAYTDVAKQIIALDPENQGGLANKYKGAVAVAEVRGLMNKHDPKGAVAKVDELLQELGAEGQTGQDLYLIRSEANFLTFDRKAARTDLDRALRAAPQGNKAQEIKGIIERVFGGE